MLYNIPTEENFPIRSRYIFYFMFSLTDKAFVMFVTFLLFQSNIYLVLAHGNGPKDSVHRDFFSTKKLNKPPLDPQLCFTCQAFSLINFPKCPKNVTFPKFLVDTLNYILKQTLSLKNKNLFSYLKMLMLTS